MRIYFPIAASLVVSLVLSLIRFWKNEMKTILIKKVAGRTWAPRLLVALFVATASVSAHAAPGDWSSLLPFSIFHRTASQSLPPEDAFLRTVSVLDYFGVPREPDSQPLLEDLQQVQTSEGIQRVLPYLDLNKSFQNYVDFNTQTGVISAFQDPRSRKIPDFSVQLVAEPNRSFIPQFLKNIRATRQNPKERPLAGLRIALDPGHMGGAVWDKRTGKFVKSPSGQILSEGLLNLQTALLLEKELQALGAEVLLTRRTLDSVSPLDFDRFDLRDFALEELRESQLMDWFQNLLAKAPPGESLYRAFSSNADFKRLFSESMRWKYFINRADLMARVDLVQRFNPDLTLIIHFDTGNGGYNTLNFKSYNATKAYVAGAFEKIEFASREDRRYFARHMLDPVTWNSSVQLSKSIISQIGKGMGIRPDSSGGSESTRRIAPGVYSRNLHLNRKIVGAPLSYLECLFYNDATEFKLLSSADHSITIGGQSYSYSNRLVSLANSIRDGVLTFVRESASDNLRLP